MWYLFGVIVIVVVILVVFKAIEKDPKWNLKRGKGRDKGLYLKFLSKATGDKALVERLIEAERKRTPNASENSLLKLAIERWEHHHRR